MKKKVRKIGIGIFLLLLFVATAHYFVYPQHTKCMLIQFSHFKKENRLYFSPQTPQQKIDSLHWLIEKATDRNTLFWGEIKARPSFIYCDTDADFKKYGTEGNAPALTILKMDGYIVLSRDGVELDIIAHELAHAEFYERIGFWKQQFAIPYWFNEGLAMQLDERSTYSEDSMQMKTANLKHEINVRLMEKQDQFFAGTNEQIQLNYMAAKHEIKNWLTKEKLQNFILQMQAGKKFEEAYAFGLAH
jgi:hypothetical protein